jgi:hypothetical protein
LVIPVTCSVASISEEDEDDESLGVKSCPGKTLEHVNCVGWWWLVHRRVLREREKKKRQVRRNEKVHLSSFLFVGGVGGATSDVLLE